MALIVAIFLALCSQVLSDPIPLSNSTESLSNSTITVSTLEAMLNSTESTMSTSTLESNSTGSLSTLESVFNSTGSLSTLAGSLSNATESLSNSTVSMSTLESVVNSTGSLSTVIDPALDGKVGNPGAVVLWSDKYLDIIHAYIIQSMSNATFMTKFGEVNVSIDSGLFLLKSPIVNEAKFANFSYELAPPNRINSRLFGIRLAIDSDWEFKPDEGNKSIIGKYRGMVSDGELETTVQVGRRADKTPMVETVECKANFSKFELDVQGDPSWTEMPNCEGPLCPLARTFYEHAICQILTKLVKISIDDRLASFPTMVNITEDVRVEYNLLDEEPKVADGGILAGLEGRVIWRDNGTVPFHPASINLVDNDRMFSFGLSDYAINTLLHQAQIHDYMGSAAKLLAQFPSIKDLLSLNCSMDASKKCLGSFLEKFNISQPFAANDTGDLVFDPVEKAAFVFVTSENASVTDGGLANLEIWGPATGEDKKRQLLVRTLVRMLKGEFHPKWNGENITGTTNFHQLVLEKPGNRSSTESIMADQSIMTDEWLADFANFSMPILNDMSNSWSAIYSQFRVPLPAGFKCVEPKLIISNRTMQIDCDIQNLMNIDFTVFGEHPLI